MTIRLKSLLALLLWLGALPVAAQVFVLDQSNGYSVTVASGLTLTRGQGTQGQLDIVGGLLSFEDPLGTASFADQPVLGSGQNRIGSDTMQRMVDEALPLELVADATGRRYRLVFSYWSGSRDGDFGAPPPGAVVPGAAMIIAAEPTSVPALPLAWAAVMGLSTLSTGALLFLRRRRTGASTGAVVNSGS